MDALDELDEIMRQGELDNETADYEVLDKNCFGKITVSAKTGGWVVESVLAVISGPSVWMQLNRDIQTLLRAIIASGAQIVLPI